MENKKWQNLIHRKCPKCDSRLKWIGDWFRCPDSQCSFAISGIKVVEILTDEKHIVQQYMTPHEKQILIQGIKSLTMV